MDTPVRIFIVYARKDKEQLELLKKQLRPLVQRGHVKVWYDGELVPGEHWEIKIKSELYNAHLVLLVVSVEYFDSEYIQEKELHIIKEREAKKRTHVVPILLSPCLWKEDPFLAKLQFLPSDARPVLASGWFDANEAWANVAEGIANVVLPKVKEMREENRVNDELRWEALRKGRNRFALRAYLNDYHKLNRTDPELHLHHADSLLGEIRSAVRHLRAVRRVPSNHSSLERKRARLKEVLRKRITAQKKAEAEAAARQQKEREAAEEAARLQKEQAEAAALAAKQKAEAEEAAREQKERETAEEAARLQKEQAEAALAAKQKAEAEAAARQQKEREAAEEAARLQKEQAEAAALAAKQKADAEEAAREQSAREAAARLQKEQAEAAALAAKQKAEAEEAERKKREQAAAVPFGVPFVPITVPIQPPRPDTEPYRQPPTEPEKEKKRRRSAIVWIVGLAAALLLALGIYGYGLWFNKDSDGDGVRDRVDACASVFGDKNNGGCPTDTDGDGIPDESDACASVFGDKNYGGCPPPPDSMPLPDTDGDGIPDEYDNCSTVPGVKAKGGCPESTTPPQPQGADSDNDGVLDENDKCPTVPGVKAKGGCPASTPPPPTGTYTETVNGVSFTMVGIPGGAFTMGDLFGEGEDNETQHRVTLSGYHLGATEVTQALWRAVMGTNPSRFSGCAQCPVEMVSWEDAVAFIGKLNKLATSGHTYRLPTEAEWEYAAREGGEKVRFGNGSNEANPAQMNFDGSKYGKQSYSIVGVYREKTTPVKTFTPNALGLYDMAGNVWEWCADWYGAYGGAATNPKGPNTGSYRVIRGGSWFTTPQFCRVATRSYITPVHRISLIGFRLASQ